MHKNPIDKYKLATEPTFRRALKLFISDIRVNSQIDEEEQDYIMFVANNLDEDAIVDNRLVFDQTFAIRAFNFVKDVLTVDDDRHSNGVKGYLCKVLRELIHYQFATVSDEHEAEYLCNIYPSYRRDTLESTITKLKTFRIMTIKELAEDIYVEILVGGDRFDKTDIETVIAAHKFNRTELYKLVHDKLEQSLAQPDCAAGKITDEYYVTAMNYWCMSTACYAIHKAMTDKLNEQQIQVCKDIIKFGPYDYASETILGVNHAVYACCSNDVQHGKYKGEQLTGIVSDIAKLNLPIVQVRYDWLGDGKSDMLLFSLTELKCGIRDLNEWARFNS